MRQIQGWSCSFPNTEKRHIFVLCSEPCELRKFSLWLWFSVLCIWDSNTPNTFDASFQPPVLSILWLISPQLYMWKDILCLKRFFLFIILLAPFSLHRCSFSPAYSKRSVKSFLGVLLSSMSCKIHKMLHSGEKVSLHSFSIVSGWLLFISSGQWVLSFSLLNLYVRYGRTLLFLLSPLPSSPLFSFVLLPFLIFSFLLPLFLLHPIPFFSSSSTMFIHSLCMVLNFMGTLS